MSNIYDNILLAYKLDIPIANKVKLKINVVPVKVRWGA